MNIFRKIILYIFRGSKFIICIKLISIIILVIVIVAFIQNKNTNTNKSKSLIGLVS